MRIWKVNGDLKIRHPIIITVETDDFSDAADALVEARKIMGDGFVPDTENLPQFISVEKAKVDNREHW